MKGLRKKKRRVTSVSKMSSFRRHQIRPRERVGNIYKLFKGEISIKPGGQMEMNGSFQRLCPRCGTAFSCCREINHNCPCHSEWLCHGCTSAMELESFKCKICYNETMNILYFPCLHLYAGENCTNNDSTTCSICSQEIKAKLKIYLN